MQYPRLVESRTAGHEVTAVGWNPGMDLLATVFDNSALTCSRLLSLQKVWHKSSIGTIISIAWRPDGRVLAIGAYDEKTKENICTLHDVEDGKEIHFIKVDDEITSIEWSDCTSTSKQNEQTDPLRSKKLIPALDIATDNFSHQLAHKQSRLNILMISTKKGVIRLYALGLSHLCDICIYTEPNIRIIQTHMSNCMRYITSVQLAQTSAFTSYSTLKIDRLDTLQSRSDEILNVAKMYAKITDELEYLDDTLSAITTSWTDVLAGLDNKLSTYCSRKVKQTDDSVSGSYTFIGADDLLQLLVIGHSSDNLEKFLSDMSDKGLRKLNGAIEQTCLRIQNLIVKNAEKCCYHLHSDLNILRGMSLWRERYKDIGLDDKPIVEAMKDVGSFMLKLTELQQVIDHSLKSTKSFFKWLISIACRLTGEHGQAPNPDVTKTTQQDIQLITDFILENFDYNSAPNRISDWTPYNQLNETGNNASQYTRPTCSNFTLEQVGQYLKNEPLTRLKYSFTKPESNFWIDFFQSRPEMHEPKILEEDGSSVLLFYPHRPDTSLIQEHKRACSTIKAAFKSMTMNLKLASHNDSSLIELEHFIKNSPTARIRVETDMRSMEHYTLFQTKDSPVSKQFLISHSLENKTFRLISIEFQTNNPNQSASRQTTSTRLSSGLTSNIMISDSCFYEYKEAKKMLMTFLLQDQTDNDTLIVQIELDKILAMSGSVERSPKEIGKVFRSNDTIEKQSSQVILKLDLQTEPAFDRKHEPEMMVKRIKGVLGLDMFASSSRGVIAFTSSKYKRLHLYELESAALGPEIIDDEVEIEDKVDDSLIDTDLIG